MKIAFLAEKYTPDIGGLAISAERITHLLAAAGNQIRVFAPTTNLSAAETWTHSSVNLRVTRFGARKRTDDTLVDWFELLVQEYKRDPFDVIHAYFLTQAGFVATLAGRYLGVPSVISARGNDLERAVFDPSRAAHILYALQNASAVTTNANQLAQKAAALVPGVEITVIPNGIDSEHFQWLPRNNALAESLRLTNGRKLESWTRVIGFAGELREKKGLRPLLSSYAQVSKRNPATLLIVGEVRVGEEKQFFEDFMLSHPEAQIIVTGFVSPVDLPAYYALMDIFVQPSLRDGLPNALLEAMACEKAVIGTPVGGLLDAITDCKNGRLVSINEAGAFADAMDDLLNKEDIRKKLGKAARQTILEKFTPQSELDGNLAVYSRLGL